MQEEISLNEVEVSLIMETETRLKRYTVHLID